MFPLKMIHSAQCRRYIFCSSKSYRTFFLSYISYLEIPKWYRKQSFSWWKDCRKKLEINITHEFSNNTFIYGNVTITTTPTPTPTTT